MFSGCVQDSCWDALRKYMAKFVPHRGGPMQGPSNPLFEVNMLATNVLSAELKDYLIAKPIACNGAF